MRPRPKGYPAPQTDASSDAGHRDDVGTEKIPANKSGKPTTQRDNYRRFDNREDRKTEHGRNSTRLRLLPLFLSLQYPRLITTANSRIKVFGTVIGPTADEQPRVPVDLVNAFVIRHRLASAFPFSSG